MLPVFARKKRRCDLNLNRAVLYLHSEAEKEADEKEADEKIHVPRSPA